MLGVGKVGASRCHELAAIGRAVVQTNTNTKIEASVKKRRDLGSLSCGRSPELVVLSVE